MTPTYTFLPWFRRGLAASVDRPDPLDGPVPERASLSMRLSVNQGAVDVPARLQGPGDVLGLQPTAILGTTPSSLDAPAYGMASIDFALPDLPWLLTPAGPTPQGQLRPWLVLVVVREGPGVTLVRAIDRGLPELRIGGPATPGEELPDLAESWAWAHVRVVGDVDGPIDGVDADRLRSTLICPRRLEPRQRYLAALVPAFDAGRRAGLGEEADDDDVLLPAWGPDDAEVRLPVYHHWRFSTDGGDFETLARRLQARPLPDDVGSKALVVDDHSRLGPVETSALVLEGALRPPAFQRVERPAAVAGPLADRLAPSRDAQGVPVVTAPVYGGPAAGKAVPDAPGWLADLNLDPRFRYAAGLGTSVVQRHQERLVAEAWRQLGDARRAARFLRHAQVARFSSAALFTRHVAALPTAALLRVAAPSSTRRAAGATAVTFRRLARPAGPLKRRMVAMTAIANPVAVSASNRAPGFVTTDQVHDAAMDGGLDPTWSDLSPIAVAEAAPRPRFLVAPDGVERPPQIVALAAGFPRAGRLGRLGGIGGISGRVEVDVAIDDGIGGGTGPLPNRDNRAAQDFRSAAEAHQAALFDMASKARRAAPADPPAADASRVGLADIASATVLTARLRARLQLPDRPSPGADPLGPIRTGPEFRGATLKALTEVSTEAILPGLSALPDDSVTLAETNPAFVEAFLVGLNHELTRELIWRDYPADVRWTAFRRFWSDRDDIPPITAFDPNSALGTQTQTTPPPMALVLRGALVRRFPTFAVYAVPATWVAGERKADRAEGGIVWPIFEGRLDEATRFVGLPLSLGDVRGADDESGGAGWFFVLEEAITAPRFGMDAPAAVDAGPRQSWNDLSWAHVPERTHCPIGEVALSAPGAARWGRNAAHMAHILLQRPARVVVHARDLLGDSV